MTGCSADGMISLILDSLYLVYFLVAFSILHSRASAFFIYLLLRCVRGCTTIACEKLWIRLAAERDSVRVLLTTAWRCFFTRVVAGWLEVQFLLEVDHVSYDRDGKFKRARQPKSILKPLEFLLRQLRTRIASKKEILYMLEKLGVEEHGSDEQDEGSNSNLGATGRRYHVRMHPMDTAHVKTKILAGLRSALMCCYRGNQSKSGYTPMPKTFPVEHHGGYIYLIQQLEKDHTIVLSTQGSAMTAYVSRGMINVKRHGLSRPRNLWTGGGAHCTRGQSRPVRRAGIMELSAECGDSDAVAMDLLRGAWTTSTRGRIGGSASNCSVAASMLAGSVPRTCHRLRNTAKASAIDTAFAVGMVAASSSPNAAPTGREEVSFTFASQAMHGVVLVSSIHPHPAEFHPFVLVPAHGRAVVVADGATKVRTGTLVIEPRRHGCSCEGLDGQAEKPRQVSRVRTLRSMKAQAARFNRYNKKEGGLKPSRAMIWTALVGGSAASAGGGHAGQSPEGPLQRAVPSPARPSKLPSSGRSVRCLATRTGLALEVRCRGGERSVVKTTLGRRRSRQLRSQSEREKMAKVSFPRRGRLHWFSSRWPGGSSRSSSTDGMAWGQANSTMIHLAPVSLPVDGRLRQRPALAFHPEAFHWDRSHGEKKEVHSEMRDSAREPSGVVSARLYYLRVNGRRQFISSAPDLGQSSDSRAEKAWQKDRSDRRAEDLELSSYLKHFWVGEKYVRVSSRGFNKSSRLGKGKGGMAAAATVWAQHMAKLGGFLTDALNTEKKDTSDKIRREPAGTSNHYREDKPEVDGSLATRPSSASAMVGCHWATQGRSLVPAGDRERAHSGKGKDKGKGKSGVCKRLRGRTAGVKEGNGGSVGDRKESRGPSAAELLRLPIPMLMKQ